MEKRIYSRLHTELSGTMFVDGKEVPISIHNISEGGLGFRYLYRDCPDSFRVKNKQKVSVVFFDPDDKLYHNNGVQYCELVTVQTRNHTKHSYVGGKLTFTDTDYPQYVADKKALAAANRYKYMLWSVG